MDIFNNIPWYVWILIVLAVLYFIKKNRYFQYGKFKASKNPFEDSKNHVNGNTGGVNVGSNNGQIQIGNTTNNYNIVSQTSNSVRCEISHIIQQLNNDLSRYDSLSEEIAKAGIFERGQKEYFMMESETKELKVKIINNSKLLQSQLLSIRISYNDEICDIKDAKKLVAYSIDRLKEIK